MFKSYIDPEENKEAKKALPKLMVEGLLMGGSGLGVLALIFEIAADAFSVAAYQTLLAIEGAQGHHEIAIYAFIVLSILLFLGIVPAYKAGAYLRPNAGGSGPLVEAIGPPKLRWLSWIGTSLFFIDAVLTIIISAISAADATMLLYPEMSDFRILLAELFAFFIMGVLVLLGPKRAVPLFLIGGGAFTIFSILALAIVGSQAALHPEWNQLADGIVSRLEANGVVDHVVRKSQDVSPTLMGGLGLSLFFKSMSSAMLGFSGYEVIPASGKHAARPKWKVINTALTLAAVFLIGTGIFQLFSAARWQIPATAGYSTLLIEYEMVSAQTFGSGVDLENIEILPEDYENAAIILEHQAELAHEDGHEFHGESPEKVAENLAIGRAVEDAITGTRGSAFLLTAGVLLAVILLLAQGGGYIGGSAVAANAARLGRMPKIFLDDRIGIAVIWLIAAILIPIIRDVVTVEAYYAFGFVSAFVITSTTVFLAREEALIERGIEPGSAEAKSLKFAGFRGMLASYFMAVVLLGTKYNVIPAIVIAGTIITLFQIYISRGGWKKKEALPTVPTFPAGTNKLVYDTGDQRAHDDARQRGIVEAVKELTKEGAFGKYNVGPTRIQKMICYLYNIDPELFEDHEHHDHERIEEPSGELEDTYLESYNSKTSINRHVENYSHYGIFTFIHNYHENWISPDHGRTAETIQKSMIDLLFPLSKESDIWEEFQKFEPQQLPEPLWQFARHRYMWAKDQWPNLSDRITTIWTLQDLGIIGDDIDVEMVVSASDGKKRVHVKVPAPAHRNQDKDKDKGKQ